MPGLGGSHMQQTSKACTPELLSLRSGTWEPKLLSPHATTAEARVPVLATREAPTGVHTCTARLE